MLYSEPENIGMLQLFTERFKTRFIEMVSCEADLAIRKASISILESIDRHGLLEDDQRGQLLNLIFHLDLKVRKAIAPFFVSRIKEAVEELVESGVPIEADNEETARGRLWYKCFARLLISQSQHLDTQVFDDSLDIRESQNMFQLSTSAAMHDIAVTGQPQGRFACAAQAIWDLTSEAAPLHRWEDLAHYIILDHSGTKEQKQLSTDSDQLELEEHQVLEESEESALIEVLVAVIALIKSDAELVAKKVNLVESTSQEPSVDACTLIHFSAGTKGSRF